MTKDAALEGRARNALSKDRVFRRSTVILLGCFFAISVVLPLLTMLFKLANADVGALLTDKGILRAARHSLCVSAAATLVSISAAACAAWCMTRTSAPLKAIFNVCILLPMLIPSISHGMGLIILFGSHGVLTRLFGLSKGIYGFTGILTGSVMYSFPVAYIMLSDILRYQDGTPLEAAAVLGIPKGRRFTAITLPYLRKPLISVVFAVFTMIVTDYGVPLMIGGMYKTLPKLMYEEVICGLHFEKGSFFGLILLLPAAAAFLADLLCKGGRESKDVSRPVPVVKKPLRDTVAFLLLIAVSVCALLPIVTFSAIAFTENYPVDNSFSFRHILEVFQKGAGRYFLNSVLIAVFTALVGTALSFFCACFTARNRGAGLRLLHLMSILSLAVPGIVLGLSYALCFSGSLIYGTLAILVLVNTVHFFSSPYLMIYNSLGKLNPDLENAASSLGISRFRLLRDVFLPQTKSTLAEMFSYFFVNSMMTISAVAFLDNMDTKPLSLLIPQFEAQMLLEAMAFVSLLILAVNLLLKAAVCLAKRAFSGRKRKICAIRAERARHTLFRTKGKTLC